MAPETATPCNYCSDLLQALLNGADSFSPGTKQHHATWGALLASSEDCLVCKTIGARLSKSVKSEHWSITVGTADDAQASYAVKIKSTSAQKMPSGVCWGLFQVGVRSSSSPLHWFSEFTLLVCRPEADAGSGIASIWGSQTPDLEGHISTIRSWFRECSSDNTHNHCHTDHGPGVVPFAPSRLITTGVDGKPCRLVDGSEPGHAEYATLSHGFDTAPPPGTTKGNLADLRSEIPSELLPRAFSEAIAIARGLDIPYIWIDALCIVQDDENERAVAKEQRAQIYQGSQLTIMAAQSTDSAEGLFPFPTEENLGFREGDAFFGVQPTDGGDSTTPGLLVRCYTNDIRLQTQNRTLISRRGWSLQEQLLSPRTVYCMAPEMHWQCQSSCRSEAGLVFDPAAALDAAGKEGHTFLYRGAALHGNEDLTRSAWRRIAEESSTRRFDGDGLDRVPAMEGVTRYFETLLPDDSCAFGVWSKAVARELAWVPLDEKRLAEEPPKETGLPSWSWYASRGSFKFDFFVRDEPVEHTQCMGYELSRTRETEDTPGVWKIKAGRLKVKGPVREIPLAPFPDGDLSNPPYLQVFGEDLQFAEGRVQIPWRSQGQFDAGKIKEGKTYVCLLLFSTTRESQEGVSSAHDCRETFLIMEPVGESDEKTHKRVGVAFIDGSSPTFDLNETAELTLV